VTKSLAVILAIIIFAAVIAIAIYYVTHPGPTPPPPGPFYDFYFDREASSGFDATYLYDDKDAFNLSRTGTGTVVLVFTSNIDSTIEFEYDDLRLDPPPPPSGIEINIEPTHLTLKSEEEIHVNLTITANIAETLIPLQFEVFISFDFTIPDLGTVGGKTENFLLLIVPSTNSAPFSMEVIPRPTIPKSIEENILSIAGQRVVFLVAVTNTGAGSGYGKAVDISATVAGAEVSVQPEAITVGEVAEVTLIPDQTSVNKTLTLNIRGQRNELQQTETISVEVIEGEDDLYAYAVEMRDRFIPWLATNQAEFGITAETQWTGTIVNPRILVVMHYIFYSEDWEIYVTWHVTIAPYDWTRIYLRNRFTDISPSYAFEISSVQGQEEPHSIEVPEWV
jgi:hypothetical protein